MTPLYLWLGLGFGVEWRDDGEIRYEVGRRGHRIPQWLARILMWPETAATLRRRLH